MKMVVNVSGKSQKESEASDYERKIAALLHTVLNAIFRL